MSSEDVIIDYTNHRGERFTRKIRPVRIWFGSTEWHDQDQWMLEAHDYSRNAARNFSLADIHAWSKEEPDDGA